MELKHNPQDNGNGYGQPNDNYYDGSSYYQADGQTPYSQPGYGQPSYTDPGYGQPMPNDQTVYDFPQNPYTQVDSYDQPVNPYQQAGYGRVDLGDEYYNPEAQAANIGMFDGVGKTAAMNMDMGRIDYNQSNDRSAWGDTSNQGYHHNRGYHHRGYQERRAGNAMAAAVSAATLNSALTASFVYMFIALLLTGITSLVVAAYPAFYMGVFAMGRVGIFLILGVELLLVAGCNYAVKKDNTAMAAIMLYAFAIVNGITFSVIFLAFTLSSIVTVFFMTSVIFGVMAIYGAVTKKDLTGWGPILFAGLLAVLFGSILNIFLGSTMADFAFTILGVVVFTLYTAYDVNKIAKLERMNTGLSTQAIGIYGALQLYLDFINLFLKLLRLFGKRK